MSAVVIDVVTPTYCTDEQDRRTLQQSDIVAAIKGHEVFDFLSDILPSSSTAAVKKEGESAGQDRFLIRPSSFLLRLAKAWISSVFSALFA